MVELTPPLNYLYERHHSDRYSNDKSDIHFGGNCSSIIAITVEPHFIRVVKPVGKEIKDIWSHFRYFKEIMNGRSYM
jgi:hypothetical protein